MSDIVFMDTETLGLSPTAPIWEFAAIRRSETGVEREFHCFIDHYPLPWLDTLPDEFGQDYRTRYSPEKAITRWDAAKMVQDATRDAHVIGAVPSFDTQRLQRMLLMLASPAVRPREPWHYHLIDVENVVVGYLAGRGTILHPPYDSNTLSMAVGVDPANFDRHTAMGDVLWVRAQFDAVMGNATSAVTA